MRLQKTSRFLEGRKIIHPSSSEVAFDIKYLPSFEQTENDGENLEAMQRRDCRALGTVCIL